MNLQAFFDQLRHDQLTVQEKHRIYVRFLHARKKVSLRWRMRYYAKVTVFSLATLSIFWLFFSTYTPEKDTYTLTDFNEAMLTFQPKEGRVAQAQNLGEIVNIQGKIAVYKGNKLIPADTLQDGDIVVLQRGARVEVTLLDGVLATIQGPAEFMIRDMWYQGEKGHVYMLHLLKGTSVTVMSLPKEDSGAPTTSTHEAVPTKALIVKTQFMEVEQPDIEKPVDMVLEEKQGVPTLVNEGSDVVVKQLVDGDEIETLVETDKVAILNDEDLLVAEDIADLLPDEFAIRYDIENTEEVISSDTASGTFNEPLVIQEKEVMTDETLRVLERLTTSRATSNYLQDMAFHYRIGNDGAYDIAFNNLKASMRRAAEAVEYPLDIAAVTDIATLSDEFDTFAVFLDTTYFVTPDIITKLQELAGAVRLIATFSFGGYAWFDWSYAALVEQIINTEEVIISSLLIP